MPILKKKWLGVSIICIILTIILYFFMSQATVTKESIIRKFNHNVKSFEKIRQYLQNTKGELHIYDNSTIDISINNNYKTIKLNKSIKSDVNKIINELKYEEIYKDSKGTIIFTRTDDNGEEQGIYYSKNNIKYGWRNVKICDGWYYYNIAHSYV